MQEIYRLLADGETHSGSKLGARLGLSRAAIWKRVKKLQEQGIEIITVPGKGYRLARPANFIDVEFLRKQATGFEDVHLHEKIDSTNAEIKRLIKQGCLRRLVIAEEQTAGMGRRGRRWASPYAANVYLSLAWPVTRGVAQLEGLSLVIGLAVYRTLKPHLSHELGLKWPNDVLVGDRKISGILIELMGDPADSCFAVIGIGINVNQAVDVEEIANPWTSVLLETGQAADRNQLIADLLANLDFLLEQQANQGFAVLREDWQAAHLWQGRKVALSFADKEIEGVVQGVNNKGELGLLLDDGVRYFAGGEISVRLRNDC